MSTERAPENLPPLSAWRTAVLRLTAFTSPTAQYTRQNWWEELFGEQAETKASNSKIGEQNEAGPFNNARLTLHAVPTRIDWLFGVGTEPIVLTDIETVTHGTFMESVEPFVDVMSRWLSAGSSPTPVRIAFGSVLLQPAADKEEAIRRLADYLPITLLPGNASDFLYQVNRPRVSVSGITGLMINRLSKWSVLQIQQQMAAIGTPKAIQQFPPVFANVLELDINTAAEFEGELDRARLPDLLRELVDLGEEIAEKGDIP